MARRRASMREGPLAELFRATEAAQRAQGEQQTESETAPRQPEPTGPSATVQPELPIEPDPEDVTLEATVEHVYDFELSRPEPVERRPEPEPEPALRPCRARPSRARRGGAGRRADPEPDRRSAAPAIEHEPVAAPYAASREPLLAADAREPRRASRSSGGEIASYLAVIRVVGVGGAGHQRGQPDDGRRDRAGRLRRRQHGCAAARALRRAGQDPHRPVVTQGLGSGADPETGRRPRRRTTTRSSAALRG